jgi:hypothetical protein
MGNQDAVDSPEGAKKLYDRMRAAEERYLALLQRALSGETYSPPKLLASAKEVRELHAKFMAYGSSLLPG